MAHSKFIVIKCPACGEKFEAEREEEPTFISCPGCAMQVKISGTHDRKTRSSRRMAPASSLPSRRQETRVHFSDLATGGLSTLDLNAARKRAAQARVEDEELVIDEDHRESENAAETLVKSGSEIQGVEKDHGEGEGGEESGSVVAEKAAAAEGSKDLEEKTVSRRAIERRAAKLEERAAKLEERAAKLQAGRQASRQTAIRADKEAAEEGKADSVAKNDPAPVEGTSDAAGAADDAGEAASDSPEKEPKANDGVDELVADVETDFEKVEVRSRGERRRLRRAPKAEVPQPRGRGVAAAGVVADLRRQRRKEEAEAERVAPKQEFDSRKITEGSQWRRHQPNLQEDPDWDSDEEPGENLENPSYPHEKRRRVVLWSLAGLVGLFLVMAAYQFILAQMGWIAPRTLPEPEVATPIVAAPPMTRGEMLLRVRPLVEAFLASDSNEAALQYVRRANKVARFMKRHYLPGDFDPVSFKRLGSAEDCKILDEFFMVPVVFEDLSSRELYLEIPEDPESSDWLIDWESWEGYSEMGFTEMRRRRPQEPVLIRCWAVPGSYYNFEFSNSDQYQVFQIWNHQRDKQLWGYADSLSESYREAASALVGRAEVTPMKVTIRVRFPEETDNPDNDQVIITEFVAFSWILPN